MFNTNTAYTNTHCTNMCPWIDSMLILMPNNEAKHRHTTHIRMHLQAFQCFQSNRAGILWHTYTHAPRTFHAASVHIHTDSVFDTHTHIHRHTQHSYDNSNGTQLFWCALWVCCDTKIQTIILFSFFLMNWTIIYFVAKMKGKRRADTFREREIMSKQQQRRRITCINAKIMTRRVNSNAK